MAKASKHRVGAGTQGKHSGTGAMTPETEGLIGENMVLSNRDKSRHPGDRGLDSKQVQTDQMQEHVGNRNA